VRGLILILAMAIFPISALAQTAAANGYCTLGGAPAVTSGLSSSNYLQGIVPLCTVTVYLTGTQTKATIYADSNNTPLTNGFTANIDGSWMFYVAKGPGYDIVMSGGTPLPISPYWPKTITDVITGGVEGIGIVTNFSAGNLSPLFTTSVTNSSSTPALSFSLSSTGNFNLFGNFSGLPAVPSWWTLAAGSNIVLTPSGGDVLTISSGVAAGLNQMVPAPTVDSYGYVILYPTAYSISNSGYCTGASTNTSGAITEFIGTGLGAACAITYTGFSLPPGLLPANIKAVYGFTIAGYQGDDIYKNNQIKMTCSDGTYGGILFNNSHIDFPMNPYSLQIYNSSQAPPSFNYANAYCSASLVDYGSDGYPSLYQINSVGLIVYGAFTTPAQSGLQVVLPLSYNATLDTLGLGLVPSWLWSPGDSGTSGGTADAYTLTYLQPTPGYSLGLQEVFVPVANNATTTPTLNVDGLGAVTITKLGATALAANDLTTTALAVVIYDGTHWELQNPQTQSGAGTAISINGTSVSTANINSTVPNVDSGYTAATIKRDPTTGGVIAEFPTGTGSGVSSINSTPGAFTFAGAGVSCSGTTCSFSAGGGGGSSIDILSPGKPSGTTLGTYQKDGTVIASSTLTLLSYVPITITAWSINGSNVATFTASNTMNAGQQYLLSGFTTGSFFNGQTITVLAAGLSSSQFEANFTHASGSASESGTATPLPGYVSRVWVALQGADPSNCTVKIFINGSGTASISVPLQNFFLATYAYQNAQVPSALSTYFTSYNQTTGTGSTYSFTLPIPFTTGIQVAIVNTTASTLTDWYMVDYHMGVPNTWPYTEVLHVDVNTDVTGITANTVTTLTNYTGGNPGRFVGMWWLEDSAPGSLNPVGASMEGAFALYLDGSASPNITSSGTEDWFGYGYYFGGNGLPQTYSSAPGGQIPGGWMDASGQVTIMNMGTTNGKTDSAVRYHLIDPIYFNSGLKMTWACGNTSYVSFTGTCTLWSTVFYYTQQ